MAIIAQIPMNLASGKKYTPPRSEVYMKFLPIFAVLEMGLVPIHRTGTTRLTFDYQFDQGR